MEDTPATPTTPLRSVDSGAPGSAVPASPAAPVDSGTPAGLAGTVPSPAPGDPSAMDLDLTDYRSLLFRAAHAQRALMHPFMASIGLGTGQPKFLSYLHRFGACSQRELANYFELDPAGVSRALDALERKGFVTFEQDASDRRAKVVRLTPEGARVAQSWDAACCEEAQAMLEGFSAKERAVFANYLTRAHANLRAYSKRLAAAKEARRDA